MTSFPTEIDGIQILGLACSQASISSLGLCLGFGELVPYSNPALKGKFKPKFRFYSNISMWRISMGKALIVGEQDEEVLIAETLTLLIGKSLDSVEIIADTMDVKLRMSGQFLIDVIRSSKTDSTLEFVSDNQTILVGSDGLDINLNNEVSSRLTQIEETIDAHTEASHKRWQSRYPKNTEIGACKKCAFYCPLQGRFYFWDYGICSNSASESDGLVVNVSGGCNKYSSELSI